jgi:nucleotide-binding universal stress UspA family protein
MPGGPRSGHHRRMATILVGVDGDGSEAVLREAARYAELFDADLRVVHAEPRGASAWGASSVDIAGEERALAVAEQAAARVPGLDPERVSWAGVVGDPGAVLCAEAERSGVDLVVVGSRGHGRIVGAVLGSVAQHVTARAPCPVLVV